MKQTRRRVRDDLVDGREALRLDDLERLEMTAVQLDEARNLLDRGTVSHARLAFILLDNAAEVIMRRNAEVALAGNILLERIRDRWDEILTDAPGDAEARRQRDEVHAKIVPERARKELSRSFDASVDFARGRGGIRDTEARVLKKLHWYRNELYHRDHLRPETIRSACLLYFDLTCALFERLPQYQLMTASLHMETPPALRKFNPPGTAKGYPAEEQIAAVLRSDLGIDDSGLKGVLSAHLTSRLNELDAAIARVGDTLFGTLLQLAPSGPWRQAVVHLAQWTDKELPASFDELLAAEVEHREADLASWKQRAVALREVGDRMELFAAFADIEDDFEPLEEQMTALDQRLEREIQHEVDLQRGK